MHDAMRVGDQLLKKRLPEAVTQKFTISIARDLMDYQRVVAIRAAVFMAEQACPFEEEFDGNDFNATHLIAYDGIEPVGCMRLRWFNGFCKLERVCVLTRYRGSDVIKLMLASCFELAARKNYTLMIGQIQKRLIGLWSSVFKFSLREGRKPLVFSGYEYVEIDIPLPAHPDAIGPMADPYEIIRPEGSWDTPGVLDQASLESARAA